MYGLFTIHEPIIGLDLGDNTVRALQIFGTREKARLDAAGSITLGKNVVVQDQIMDSDAVVKSLKQLLDRPEIGRFTSTSVVAGLPEAKCFVRVIHVDKLSDKELAASIPFEAESYIPLPLDQVYLDWQVLGEKNGRLEVLLIASPKEYVDKLAECLVRVGLEPVAFEVQCQGLVRATTPPDQKGSVLLVDMETARTVVSVAERGAIHFTSTLPVSGLALTEVVAKGLGVDQKKAEEIKIQVGFTNTPEYPNIKILMTPVMKGLASELQKTIDYNNAHGFSPVVKILLGGAAAQLPGFKEFLASEFVANSSGITVEVGDPLQNIHVSSVHTERMQELSLGYGTAIGLALREVVL